MDLREKVDALPERPGVYVMKDERGRVLYVGKAKSLRDRVGQYFTPSYRESDARLGLMIDQIRDIEVIETATEVDALFTESRLVKDLHPKYNVMLRDDKSFAMLELTTYDDFPKARVVFETDPIRGDRMGPFIGGWDLRNAVKVMQKIFKFATCNIEMRVEDPKRRFFRPCILHAIKRCSAPCADRISKEAYAADVASLRKFLRGERKELVADLTERMVAASKRQDYERAAECRDQIRALESLDRRAGWLDYIEGDLTPLDPKECIDDLTRVLGADPPLRTIEGIDIANISGRESVGSVVAFVDGVPFKAGYRRFRIRDVEGVDDYAMIREVVRRRYAKAPPPDVLLIDGGQGHYSAAEAALTARPRVLLSLAKREETVFLAGRPFAVEKSSPAMRLLMYVRDEAHRFAQHYHHILRRKAVLEAP